MQDLQKTGRGIVARSGDRFTGPMYRRLWGPAMLSSLGWALSDMADAVVVGQSLGTTGLAAISLILPVYMINCMIVHGLGTAGSADPLNQRATVGAKINAYAATILNGDWLVRIEHGVSA